MPSITETELKKHIKTKSFSPAYVLYGDEQLLIGGYTKKLITAITGKNPSDFNLHTFSGDFDLDDFAAAIQIIPFMSEYNCVVVSDMVYDEWQKDAKKKDKLKRFKELTAKPCEGTVLIVSMPSYKADVNKSTKKAPDFLPIVKHMDKYASIIKFGRLSQTAVEKYIGKWASENGKMISHINASKLIASCGDDLTLLHNEINKICAYASGEEITLEDIEKLATVTLEAKIFALGDAVINGDGQRAFNILDTLFYQQEEPNAIIYTLAMNYIDAYRMRVANECGVMSKEVASDFSYGGRGFALDKAARSTSRVSTQALRKSLDVLLDADIKLKSTKVNPRILTEQTIAQLLLIAKEDKR